MPRRTKFAIVFSLATAGLLLFSPMRGLAEEDGGKSDEAARVEDIPGTDAKTLIFTEEALTHLDVKTEKVRELEATRQGQAVGLRLAIPHSAMGYDAEGKPWVYVKEGPDTFVRRSVEVDFMDADNIYLASGLAAGEEVVTVGVPEMQGVEFGVGEGE